METKCNWHIYFFFLSDALYGLCNRVFPTYRFVVSNKTWRDWFHTPLHLKRLCFIDSLFTVWRLCVYIDWCSNSDLLLGQHWPEVTEKSWSPTQRRTHNTWDSVIDVWWKTNWRRKVSVNFPASVIFQSPPTSTSFSPPSLHLDHPSSWSLSSPSSSSFSSFSVSPLPSPPPPLQPLVKIKKENDSQNNMLRIIKYLAIPCSDFRDQHSHTIRQTDKMEACNTCEMKRIFICAKIRYWIAKHDEAAMYENADESNCKTAWPLNVRVIRYYWSRRTRLAE